MNTCVCRKCGEEVGGGLGKADQSHSFQLAARGRGRRLKFTGKELADIIIIFLMQHSRKHNQWHPSSSHLVTKEVAAAVFCAWWCQFDSV